MELMNSGSRHWAKTQTDLASRDGHVCSLGTCNHSASLSLPFWSQEQIKRVWSLSRLPEKLACRQHTTDEKMYAIAKTAPRTFLFGMYAMFTNISKENSECQAFLLSLCVLSLEIFRRQANSFWQRTDWLQKHCLFPVSDRTSHPTHGNPQALQCHCSRTSRRTTFVP